MRRPRRGCPLQSWATARHSAMPADEISANRGRKDTGGGAGGVRSHQHKANMKWVRELLNFPASEVQKGACKNGTPAKGDVCSGPEGVKKGQSLARENQIINEHNARAPSPGLLFPSRWSSSWTATWTDWMPLLAQPLSLGIIIDAFRFVFRHSCWGSIEQAVTTKWLI